MPDDTGTDTTADPPAATDDDKTKGPPTGNASDLEDEVKKWKDLSRKHEKTSKDLTRELEGLKTQSLTDQEKAINDAKKLGADEAKTLYGSKLVAAEIKVGLNGRISDESFDSLIKGLNVSSFLNDDGDVDSDAVSGFVKALIPAEDPNDKKKSNLNLGQGNRGTTSLADDNALENAIMRHVGVRRS